MSANYAVNVPKLKGRENYDDWAFAVENFLILEGVDLSSKNILDEASDRKARAKMILTIDPSLYVHIKGESTVRDTWNKLKSLFDDTGYTRKISLLRHLISIRLETSESMTAYVTQLVETAQKLKGTGFEISDEWIGSLLLAGLPEKFSPMIMAIEHSGMSLSADAIKTKLLDMSTDFEEKSDSAFIAKNSHRYNGGSNKTFSKNRGGSNETQPRPQASTEHRTCCACGEPIADRFLLEVGGGAWHTSCLRCCVCAVQLDRHPSCFLRDRQVYCKQDYAKSFGAKCSKCCRGISSSDWVRKAREQVYHLACFACDACGRQLSTGEQFALHEDRVLCKPHYLETLDGGSISSDDGCDSEGYHKSKAKRVRTTFTEEQLQVLQANFQLDSNPDGQDLERIAQVTGLSKRVTQVWFQNSRARQKKHQHTGKGKQNQLMSRDSDPVGFGRPINLHLTYSFQNKPPFVPIDGTSFTDSSMDELSEDSSIHCMQSEV